MFNLMRVTVKVHLKSGQSFEFKCKSMTWTENRDNTGFVQWQITGGDIGSLQGVPMTNVEAFRVIQPWWVRAYNFIVN